jgi:hypothetical protein
MTQLKKVVNHPKQILLSRLKSKKKDEARIQELTAAGSEFLPKTAAEDDLSEAAERELSNLTGTYIYKELAIINYSRVF